MLKKLNFSFNKYIKIKIRLIYHFYTRLNNRVIQKSSIKGRFSPLKNKPTQMSGFRIYLFKYF
ncbi:MAG: hypothetical protein CMC04_08250 [Flavobacteriaceae bacterium]|nr:hypothetical protein [Flavobacteriaceae bacterium]